MLAGAQLAAEHQAIIARHHHVEDDEVDGIGLEEGAHLPAVRHRGGAQAVLLEIAGDQLADFAIVIDDQDVIDMIHRGCFLPFFA